MLPTNVLVAFALGLAGLGDAAPAFIARRQESGSSSGVDGEMHILPYPYLGGESGTQADLPKRQALTPEQAESIRIGSQIIGRPAPTPQKRQSVLDNLENLTPEEKERARIAAETTSSFSPEDIPTKRQSLADLTPEEAERLWNAGAVAGTEGIPPEMYPQKRQSLADLSPEAQMQGIIAGTEGIPPEHLPQKRQSLADALGNPTPEQIAAAQNIPGIGSPEHPIGKRQSDDVLSDGLPADIAIGDQFVPMGQIAAGLGRRNPQLPQLSPEQIEAIQNMPGVGSPEHPIGKRSPQTDGAASPESIANGINSFIPPWAQPKRQLPELTPEQAQNLANFQNLPGVGSPEHPIGKRAPQAAGSPAEQLSRIAAQQMNAYDSPSGLSRRQLEDAIGPITDEMRANYDAIVAASGGSNIPNPQ